MRFTIRLKIILVFIIITSLVIGLNIYSVNKFKVLNDKSTEITVRWLPGIEIAHSMNTMTSDYRILEFRHIISTSNTDMAQLEKDMDVKSEEIKKQMDDYDKNIHNDTDKKLFNTVKTEWDKYIEIHKKVIFRV